MPSLFPCRDLIEAHVIRGWLAAHDIEAHVVHENAQIAYPTSAFQVRLAIHEGDFDEISEMLRIAREPLPEDFEIVEAGPISTAEVAGLASKFSLLEALVVLPVIGAISGFAFDVILTVFMLISGEINLNSTISISDQTGIGQSIWFFGLGGLCMGVPAWLSVKWAESCHHGENGELPVHARLAGFFVWLLFTRVIYVLVVLALYLLHAFH